jgi:acetylornithine deacetylase
VLIEIHLLTREFERQVQTFEAPGFDPPYTTVNNGLVRLSPGHLSYVVDVRRIPGTPAAQMLDAHEAALRKLERLGTPRSGGLQLHTLRALESTPFHAASRSELLAALRAELRVQGLPPGPEMKSGTTEAPVYQEAGMDTVVFGPGGAAGNIHRPNEHVALADLQRCIDIYQGVVLRLCGN